MSQKKFKIKPGIGKKLFNSKVAFIASLITVFVIFLIYASSPEVEHVSKELDVQLIK